MEQRRFIVFVLTSTLVLFGWLKFGPMLFPDAFPKPAGKQAADPLAADDAADDAAAPDPAVDEPAQPADDAANAADVAAAQPDAPAGDAPAGRPELQRFDNHDDILLGSLDPASGYFMQVRLTTEGAAILEATLNDPRFVTADGRNVQLSVVGNNPRTTRRTLTLDVPQINAQLQKYGESLETVVWRLVDQNESQAVFSYPAPDGSLEVRKTFKLNQGDPKNRDGDHRGYLLEVSLEFVNHGPQADKINYVLQGPVGLPLENADDSRNFTEIKVGTADNPGSPVQYTAAKLVDEEAERAAKNDPAAVATWRDPVRYVGVGVQDVAALLVPRENQKKDRDGDGKPDPWFTEIRPDLVTAVKDKPAHSDISLKLESAPITVAPGGTETHAFDLYLGPKRPELLNPLDAGGIITFGWFSIVAVGMVYLLNFFHHAFHLPYAFAIILLTLIVRACMFPITRKQAMGAKKMKELQPKLQELKAKYSKEPEKFWQAQRDLFRKHNYSPLAGCLPLFLQMPIFLGLYSALSFDVDLRMAGFLWIDNLAAPDQLFAFGGAIPLLGWTHFNLLPIITICLWVVQQKMFMPPPTSDEPALQYKTMSYMMVFIGFMIYRVPAGLCIYFITSTLWGISERKLIDYINPGQKKTADDPQTIETTATVKGSSSTPEPCRNRPAAGGCPGSSKRPTRPARSPPAAAAPPLPPRPPTTPAPPSNEARNAAPAGGESDPASSRPGK